MRRALIIVSLIASVPAAAQKPWEARADLPVLVPIELPAIPPTNPFATPVETAASPIATPLREKFSGSFSVGASAYVDNDGAVRRLVFTQLPWPALADSLRPAIMGTAFTPARVSGAVVPVWLPLAVDLKGRVREGLVARLQPSAPEPATPPVVDPTAVPTPEARDLELPATPIDRIDQMPSPKRFRARVDNRSWRQGIRLLVEVSATGRCGKVVFLSCPEGLRPWLLASMAGWTFHPATSKEGPVTAWVQLDGEIEVEVGDLSSDTLRVMRQGWSPRGGAQSAAAPPPGA
ncbi:MAG TPA: hypothetical protein VMT19_04950 [Thermoanaerobaculaceae bacterium]|nr:hypothetical protein [Thermoanaerobaculaceae bacterium]